MPRLRFVVLMAAAVVSGIDCGGGTSNDGDMTSGGTTSSGGTPSSGGTTSSGGAAGTAAAPSGGTPPIDAGDDHSIPIDCGGTEPPVMVALVAPDGTPFCIDTTEVTQAEYAVFLATESEPPGSEHPRCAPTNVSYDPLVDKSPCSDGGAPGTCQHACNEKTFDPSGTPNRPVVCIDWCDAYAYCEWAGKRLCGKIGGGELSTDAGGGEVSLSQWFAACSQNGARVYPYGNSYEPTTCEGLDVTLATDAGPDGKQDVATLPCHGSGPYAAIFDLSGGVAELEDDCTQSVMGDWGCRTRGGSFNSAAADLACASQAGASIYQQFANIGFRCCKD